MRLPPPIYLHFLDRELGDAFEFALDLDQAQRAMSALAMGTMSLLTCSVSALFENEGLRGGEGMVADLVAAEVLLPQSTHATSFEFLESRKAMYEHDQARYPLYFGKQVPEVLESLEPRQVEGSTTQRLHDRLLRWTDGNPTISGAVAHLPRGVHHQMTDAVAAELERRGDRAVTYAMFGGIAAGDPSGRLVERTVRQRISLEYTDHQMGKDGELATGVSMTLEALERTLRPQAPFEFDLAILYALIRAAGLGGLLEGWPRALWQQLLPLRGKPDHAMVVSRIRWISRAIDDAVPLEASRSMRRQRAAGLINEHAASLAPLSAVSPQEWMVAAQQNLDRLARKLGEAGLRSSLDGHRDALRDLQADVLIVVATDIEEREVFREFGYPPGTIPPAYPRGHQVYFRLDVLCGQEVFMVRSRMGSGGAGGSLVTVNDAIEALRPTWVLMVGIAFGVDPLRQSIGDVLIPTEVIFYDHKRVGTKNGADDTRYRDDPVHPDSTLVDRLRVAGSTFADVRVEFGPLLSGSELIDNKRRRDGLVTAASGGRAIGGEMELSGVFAAASRRGARWAAAKAICDFADGNKGMDKAARQEQAARNAAQFVRHLIRRGLLGDPPA